MEVCMRRHLLLSFLLLGRWTTPPRCVVAFHRVRIIGHQITQVHLKTLWGLHLQPGWMTLSGLARLHRRDWTATYLDRRGCTDEIGRRLIWTGEVATTRLDGDLSGPATARMHTVIAARISFSSFGSHSSELKSTSSDLFFF